MKYRNRVRSRISNLKDPKNPSLRRNVLCGAIPPSLIARMTAEVGSGVGGGTGLALVDHVHAHQCPFLVPKGWLGLGLLVSTLDLSQHLPIPPRGWLEREKHQSRGASAGGRQPKKIRALPGAPPPRPQSPVTPPPTHHRAGRGVSHCQEPGLRVLFSTTVPKSGGREPSSLRGEPGPCRQQLQVEDGVIFFHPDGPEPSTKNREKDQSWSWRGWGGCWTAVACTPCRLGC